MEIWGKGFGKQFQRKVWVWEETVYETFICKGKDRSKQMV